MPTTDWTTRKRRDRSLGLLGVAVLHVLMALAFLGGRPVAPPRAAPDGQADGRRIQWVWLKGPASSASSASLPPAAPARPARTARPDAPLPVAIHLPPVPHVPGAAAPDAPAAAAAAAPAAVAPAAPEAVSSQAAAADAPFPAPGAADVLARARQMAGGVDRQLRKEARKPLPELVDTPYKRFVAAMEAAHAPQWSGRVTVTEIEMPGTGEKITKVGNGSSSYCIRMPSPGVGIDQYEAARHGKVTNCPR